MSAADRTKRTHPSSQRDPPALEPRTSGQAVRRSTGRDRDEWFAQLDAWGTAGRTHGEIAAWIMNEHGVDNWWAQTLTVDYEQARGLRPPGGSRDGTFAISASKTVSVPVKRLFEAFGDAELRERWLPGAVLRGFTAKGRGKSQVALQHEPLPDARAAEKAKAYWRERLAALKTLLES